MKTAGHDLSVVVVNCGMGRELAACLESLAPCLAPVGHEIIVVNKPSGDGTEETVKKYPAARLLTSPVFGVASMRNAGIRESRGRYVLLLDADTVFDARDFGRGFGDLLAFMDGRRDVAVLGVKLVGPDGRLQYSCRRFYDLRTIIFRRTFLSRLFPDHRIIRHHLMVEWNHASIRAVDWVQGAFFLMRRRAIASVGYFDEFSPFGFEDVAWCRRSRSRGWKTCYYPGLKIIHHYRRSSAGAFRRRAFDHLAAFVRFSLRHGLPKV